jgi:uncharacterized protein YneF (UPF0154 family)
MIYTLMIILFMLCALAYMLYLRKKRMEKETKKQTAIVRNETMVQSESI